MPMKISCLTRLLNLIALTAVTGLTVSKRTPKISQLIEVVITIFKTATIVSTR